MIKDADFKTITPGDVRRAKQKEIDCLLDLRNATKDPAEIKKIDERLSDVVNGKQSVLDTGWGQPVDKDTIQLDLTPFLLNPVNVKLDWTKETEGFDLLKTELVDRKISPDEEG